MCNECDVSVRNMIDVFDLMNMIRMYALRLSMYGKCVKEKKDTIFVVGLDVG